MMQAEFRHYTTEVYQRFVNISIKFWSIGQATFYFIECDIDFFER